MISKIYNSQIKLFKAWSRKGHKRDFKQELKEQAEKEKAKNKIDSQRVNPNYSQSEIRERIKKHKRNSE